MVVDRFLPKMMNWKSERTHTVVSERGAQEQMTREWSGAAQYQQSCADEFGSVDAVGTFLEKYLLKLASKEINFNSPNSY